MSSSNKVTLAKLCKQHYHVLHSASHRRRYLLPRCLSSRCLSSVFTIRSIRKAKQSIAFGLLLLAGTLTTSVSAQTVVNICDRTAVVETRILAAIPGTPACTAVTAAQLAAITELDLANMSISALQSDDFADLTGLTTLRLQGNTFTTALPADIFDPLPSDVDIEIDLSPIGDLADIALTIGGTTTINIANAFISKDAMGTDRDLSFSTTLSGTSATATVNEGVLTITASSTITGDTDVRITANDGTNDVIRTISVTVMDICSRTAQVQATILASIPATNDCAAVTATHLAAITGLLLSNRGITTLQSGDFAGLTRLTQLDLIFNDITTIEADTFSGLTSLTSLRLTSNDLSTIEANTFSGLTSLTTLILNNNDLSTIEANTFSGLTSLTTLYLDDNDLSTLKADTFSGLTSLRTLNLLGNDLSTLKADTFSGLTSLTQLELDSNALTTIEANAFSGLTSLTRLDLRFNDLTTIEANAFSALTSLNILFLRDNDLTTIEANAFSGLTSLSTLDLRNNDLTTIEAGAFSGLTSLTRLDLNSHALTTLKADTFSGLTSLTTLFLRDNDLTTIEANAFSGLTSLSTLDLRNNDLSTLKADTFSGLTSLTNLNLVANDITTIEADTFSGLTSLTSLRLTSNDLSTIEANTFSGLTSLTTLILNNNDLSTIEANTFSGLTSLTTLYLDDNDLSALPDGLFSGLGSLTTLRLQGNDFTTRLPADIFDPLPDGTLIQIDLSPIGDLADVALTVGGTTTINVASAFISRDRDGDDRTLSYTLTPANTAVATATESNGVLTITGAGMGTTTVSVTANDGRGTFTRNFAVTVTEAGILAFDEAMGDTAATVVAAENNGTDTFYVQLVSAPTSDVTMTVMSSATAEGTVIPSELTFTASDWNTRQAVTITAVPDQIDRDDTFTVDFAITSGDGGDYPDTLTLSSVQVTITDDDTAGIDAYDMLTGGSGISTITTSETAGAGNVATFYVQLTSQPTGTVTVTIGDIDATEHTLTTPASGTLTFDSTNWNTPRQLITITGQDDNIVDGDQTYDITLTATGGGYDGVVETGSATNTDTDTAALSISDLSVDENAGTATLTVTLTPAVTATGNVTVDLTTTDGTATSTDYTALTSETLIITAGETTQTLNIPINDDTIDELDETFTVMLDNLMLPAAVTGDVSITDATAIVTITDDDTLSDTINLSVSPLSVAETADATTITVTATIDGTAVSTTDTTVTVSVGGGTATSGTDYTTVSDFTLNIPAGMPSGMAMFMIDPTDDTTDDNNETVMITGTATGFATINPATLTIVEAGISVHDAMTLGNQISTVTIANENNGTGTLYVQLASPPATGSSVTISVASDDTNEGTVSTPTLTFTDTNWDDRQLITVTAVDDNVDRDDTFMVDFAVTSGDGGNYTSSLTLPSVMIEISDDDVVSDSITLAISLETIAETADATTITVTATLDGALSTMPTEVIVTVGDINDTADEGSDYTLSIPTSTITITIPALETSGSEVFAITPIADNENDNEETITISGTATINSNPVTINTATLTIVEAGISVFDAMADGNQISTFTIAEASSDTFYVELASQPVSDVILTLTSSASGEGTVTPATLTFSDTNWNARQAFTVTAVNDNIDRDGDSFMVDFAVTSGDGGNYTSSLTLPSVTVTVSDDDTPSTDITLTISRDSIQETAGETSITVTAALGGALSTMPTEVTVTVGGGTDMNEATVTTDYTLSIPTATLTLTIPALETSSSETFTITPIADNENDDEETITISGMATINSNPVTVNTATLTITGFSEEEQQVIEQTVAAQASSVTQVVSENIGSFLASRTSAPASAPAPPAPDGGGGGDVKRENFTSIDWQDWQHRFAKLAYEGLKRLDSDADMSLDWALKAAGSDGRLLMPLGIESLTLWAAGGRLKTKGDGMGEYDGGVNSFVVGVDTNLINNWLLGIAASYSDSQVDYTMDGAPIGSNEQNLYSVHPFLSHSLPEHGLTLWVTGGYGVGDIDFSHTTNDEATSDVTQWMAAGGIEKHIITNTLWQGALRLKGLWGNAVVDATEYGNGVDIRKVESTFWRARMESEMGYNFQLPGANVRPYALIGGRWDHNDAIVSGDEWHLDVGGGVEVFSGNAFALNISVHTQLTDGDTEEDSIIGTGSLTYDIGQDRQGLQITLSRPLNNTSPAWDQHSFNEVTNTASGINSAPLTSELAYGWTVRPFGLKGALQTYVQNSFGSHDRHYAVGLELAVNALTLNFESGYGEADNTGLESMLKTKIRW